MSTEYPTLPEARAVIDKLRFDLNELQRENSVLAARVDTEHKLAERWEQRYYDLRDGRIRSMST